METCQICSSVFLNRDGVLSPFKCGTVPAGREKAHAEGLLEPEYSSSAWDAYILSCSLAFRWPGHQMRAEQHTNEICRRQHWTYCSNRSISLARACKGNWAEPSFVEGPAPHMAWRSCGPLPGYDWEDARVCCYRKNVSSWRPSN